MQYFFFRTSIITMAAIVKVRIGSAKTAQNEHGSAHQKSYRKEVNFPKYLWAIGHGYDCGCAFMLRFLSAASDDATAEPQIQNCIFWSFFLPVSGRIASTITDRFGRCFRLMLEDKIYFAMR